MPGTLVNIGKDKDEAPTSTNLSSYFEKSEQLKQSLKDEKVAKLLNIIGVSVGDLTKNIYLKTDKEKLALFFVDNNPCVFVILI